MPSGVVLYRGPSRLDPSRRVVVIATRGSRNAKVGDMIQTWILDADADPVAGVRDGTGRSICGNCPLRRDADGKRRCYVNVGQAPLAVWRAAQRGRYPDAAAIDLRAWAGGRAVRLGSYGDPAAVPVRVWRQLLADTGATRWAGYTHQWRSRRFEALRLYVMASCETAADAARAAVGGWRAFLVGSGADVDTVGIRAVSCPASAEAGARTTCARCALCAGSSDRTARAPHVRILPHGLWREPSAV